MVLFPCLHSLISSRGGILESYADPRLRLFGLRDICVTSILAAILGEVLRFAIAQLNTVRFWVECRLSRTMINYFLWSPLHFRHTMIRYLWNLQLLLQYSEAQLQYHFVADAMFVCLLFAWVRTRPSTSRYETRQWVCTSVSTIVI